METKYTIGKWKVSGEPIKRTIVTTISDNVNGDFELEIATIQPKLKRGAADANAKLMAAAPEMLEMLKTVLNNIDSGVGLEAWMVQEVITKAEN